MPKSLTSWASAWLMPSRRPLGGVVHADAHEGRDPTDRRHLDDVTAALLAQEWKRGLSDPQRPEQVRLDLLARLTLAELLDHAELPVAGVVDDDVQPAEVLVRAADALERRRAVGHVQRKGEESVACVRR